ncbi:hypothetical protein ABIA39_003788 [Nocardia sp. GAS34]
MPVEDAARAVLFVLAQEMSAAEAARETGVRMAVDPSNARNERTVRPLVHIGNAIFTW